MVNIALRSVRFCACCYLLLAIAACSSGITNFGDEKTSVRVMTFNIEWGGDHVSFDNVIETIRLSEADVVGIQEAEGNLDRLASGLGWHYDRRNYTVSRYPLLDPPGADGRYVLVEVTPGRVMALANLHLPSDPYGADLVRDGAEPLTVLANERQVRLPALSPYLGTLPGLVESDMPVIVTGDFNSPAHTDWTEAMIGKRPFLNYAFSWPVTVAMENAGFSDAWRVIYPNPATNPGLTWWAGRPPLESYAPGENDAEDRIDYIWFAGPAAPQAAFIAGEVNGPEVSLAVSPWPSDHRAMFADFEIEPLLMPDLVTTDRRIYALDDVVRIRARINAPESPIAVTVKAEDGITILSGEHDGPDVQLTLRPAAAGEYTVSALTPGDSYERTFWVLPRDAKPAVSVEKSDSSTRVLWRYAPGHRNDYVALYEAGEPDLINGMLGYSYIGAKPQGTMDIAALLGSLTIGPESTRYVVRLMKDDGYEVLAESPPFNIETD